MHRENRLQRRRMPHRHLHRGESSPRDAEHPNLAIAPWLARQPCDHLFSIDLLLLGVFAFGRGAFTRTEAANVDAHADVAAPREISMLWIIPCRRAIVFAVWQIF